MSKKAITINKGYQMVERTNVVDAYFAAKNILSTRKQYKFTEATYTRASDTVELTRHVWVCPHCGANMPAYIHFLDEYTPRKRMRRTEADKWCGDIRSLFENEDKTIHLYNTFQPALLSNLICTFCGEQSSYSLETEDIVLERDEETLKVSCMITSFLELIAIDWSDFETEKIPLEESVVFDFKTGKVRLELSKPEGNIISSKDVTTGIPDIYKRSKLLRLINGNKFVRIELIKEFNKIWKSNIPLTIDEIDVNKFIFMCSFIGFTKQFYNCLPLNDDSTLASSFEEIRMQLHHVENCIKLLSESVLPNTKAIKRIFFSNPVFFFYLHETEMLWNIFNDHNLFCRFMDSKNGLSNLYMMHLYPNIVEFYKDFAREKTPLEFFRLIVLFESKACSYGIHYSSFNEHQKAVERKKWKELAIKEIREYQHFKTGVDIGCYFTVEKETVFEDEFEDQVCDGYTFTVLRNRNQFFTAAKELQNCLKTGKFFNPIVGMVKNGRYIAAIEIYEKNRWVIQALIKNNQCIEEDKTAYNAMKKWCAKNKLHYAPDEYDVVEVF